MEKGYLVRAREVGLKILLSGMCLLFLTIEWKGTV